MKTLSILTLLTLTACSSSIRSEVAKVGSYSITAKDLYYRNEYNLIRRGKKDIKSSLKQLVHAYKSATIAEKYGLRITQEQLLAEKARIDKRTLLPVMLKKIKAAFKNDDAAYLKVYILPSLVERILPNKYFYTNPELHQESRIHAKALLRKVIKSKNFSSFAKKNELTLKNVTISINRGVHNDSGDSLEKVPKAQQKKMKVRQGENPLYTKAIKGIFSKMPVKSILPEVINFGRHWLIIYLEKKIEKADFKDTEYTLQFIQTNKANYHDWLILEKNKINVWVDPKFLATHP